MTKKHLLLISVLFLICCIFVGCGVGNRTLTPEYDELAGDYKLEYSIMLRYGDGLETGDGIDRDYELMFFNIGERIL